MMTNRYLFWFWHSSMSHNIEYKVTESDDIDSGTFGLQVDILPHNTSTHLVVVGFAVRVEVCLSVEVGDRGLCVESEWAFHLLDMRIVTRQLAIWRAALSYHHFLYMLCCCLCYPLCICLTGWMEYKLEVILNKMIPLQFARLLVRGGAFYLL